ncbi:hypothetical protein OC846_001505 [Tilletia horrida]|uniref:Uncharacterized protein n=1 Tax=Tilletia horrida TaxID=155126 RepID=A0AAN6GTZ2_9BASI|nr:hypothetical protein OC846_001505 [Tilletia horrida]KAK0568841.1 hypothetical protein OC861_001534 [Tilletia horrida]
MSSSLLYTAITNRFAANTIGNGSQPEGTEDDQALNEWENVSHTSDDDLVDVQSLPGTAPGTPRSRSRPPSPPPSGAATGTSQAASPSPTKASSRSRSAAASKSKTDPLRSLPSDAFEPFEHAETFLTIPPTPFSPNAAGSVAEGSSTAAAGGGGAGIATGSAGSSKKASAAATWTRREARTDWKLTFAKQVRQARRDQERSGALGSSSGSGYSTPSRTERLASAGIMTNTERKQQQWAESESQTGYSKAQLRDHYKSQGSRGGKVKGKSGKGGVKTVEESIWD